MGGSGATHAPEKYGLNLQGVGEKTWSDHSWTPSASHLWTPGFPRHSISI